MLYNVTRVEGGVEYFFNVSPCLNRKVGAFPNKLGKSQNVPQRFIEFMGDACGQLANGSQPVGMPELILQL